jgi:hypothetical protein
MFILYPYWRLLSSLAKSPKWRKNELFIYIILLLDYSKQYKPNLNLLYLHSGDKLKRERGIKNEL